MAKNASESRIPVSRASRPSFLPKPKIISPLKNTGTSIGGNSRRSTILASGCFFPSDIHEDIGLKTPRGRFSGVPCAYSTPGGGELGRIPHAASPIWNLKSESLQQEVSFDRQEDELFGSFHGQLTMLEDIGNSCLVETTLGGTLNDINTTNINGSLSTHQYLSLNKQNSFEHDESLGILTPDQMTDFTVALGCSRTPSCENLTGSRGVPAATTTSSSQRSRPTDIQFGDNREANVLLCERSPSLEELPLDPKPPESEKLGEGVYIDQQVVSSIVVTSVASAVTSVTSAASLPMSFVTSVTSITSLEAGYQGDGENSRPASRGPDPPGVNPGSLSGNLPASCQACRLQDPMTDSDFFTESDADAHEDMGRGDRRAQVIDGTLFCAPADARRRCPSFAGEEMDSSGIYSDLDKRQDERFNGDEQVSGDQTPDTANTPDTADTADTQVSQNVQLTPILKTDMPAVIMDFLQVPKNPLDTTSDSNSSGGHEVTVIHVETTVDTNRSITKIQGKVEPSPLKKYKMPKKNVESKIKAMIESTTKEDLLKETRRATRNRKNGHWDAVMSKIEAGKSEQRLRPQRKEVKSRFMESLTSSVPTSSTQPISSPSVGTIASTKRSPGDANNNAKATKDKRRFRGRQGINSPIQETARSSVRSSMSDLSSGLSKETVSKRSITAATQQRRTVNGRASLKSRAPSNDAKKAGTLDLSPLNLEKSPAPIRKSTLSRRSTPNNGIVHSLKQVASTPASATKDSVRRESNSSTPTSARISIDTRQQATQTNCVDESFRIKRTENALDALCLTIQYLVRQNEEYSNKVQQSLCDSSAAKTTLQETLTLERENHLKALNNLRVDLETKYTERISILENALHQERVAFEARLKASLNELIKQHEIALEQLRSEHLLELEQKLAKENVQETSQELSPPFLADDSVKRELESLKSCIKPILIMKQRVNGKLKHENDLLMKKLKDKQLKIQSLETELEESRKSNNLINLETSSDQSSSLHAEVWSLRSVLELRSQENASMRSEIEILRRDVEGKDTLEQKVESLEARCEDLKAQLQSKESYERTLSHQNEILLGSFHEVSKHNKRLTQRNEELQWRLRQKNEVVSVLANQLATPDRLSRSLGPEHIDHSITPEKNPTSSSMIKFMVQKGDSVSWTLEIDESSDPLPNKDNTPTVSRQNSLRRAPRKSLDIRARSKSVSTSDAMREDGWTPSYNSTPVPVRRRPRSDPSASPGDQTPVSVVNDQQTTGPRPQEAGGEAMISEETSATSSEDESSASTDIPRLAMEFAWSNPVE
ncbi:uncharacterized protein LOC107044154 [Diachasma alloeum]|uniref:uncharacterized protein LOC107044154 n=1 Tax=Diachasma alloeum TaxID=454923 RepID=UPI0007381C05|nr:uncharacterized protein LOC107044154 [Diachasma alloeum]